MNEIGQGLVLSGIGILITFSALGILILVILLLKTLFPEKKSNLVPPVPGSDARVEGGDRDQIRKRAAATAIAALLSQKGKPNSELGSLLESPPGNWWREALNRNQNKE